MGFESYTVHLVPDAESPMASGQEANDVLRLTRDIKQVWPDICLDAEELNYLAYPPDQNEIYLAYESDLGLFQLVLSLYREQITISLRFAFCNPRSIYGPFTSMIAWLMGRYRMHGYTLVSDQSLELTTVEALGALTPSMDYNRELWQMDVRTTEEAILRPGDAIVRFCTPLYLSTSIV